MVRKSSKLFVGMDGHKDSIDVAAGDEAGGEVRHYGTMGGDRAAVSRLVRKLEATGKALVFGYEAGPCGFGIDRLLRGRPHGRASALERAVRRHHRATGDGAAT